MLNNLKKNRSQKGFTIIEVMIVLAIAALILLIVFLAVPALQRSSRNTQRKNDAAQIASTISTYLSDNNGNLPTSLGNNSDTNSLDLCTGGGATEGGGTACTGNIETVKMGYYSAAEVYAATWASGESIAPTGSGTTPTANSVTPDSISIIWKATCNSATVGSPTNSTRDAAVFYDTETAGGQDLQCVAA